MTINMIRDALQRVHRRYASKKGLKSGVNAELCDLWSISNPPDTLSETRQADDIIKSVDCDLTELQLVRIYDMNIASAAIYINCIKANTTNSIAQQGGQPDAASRRRLP